MNKKNILSIGLLAIILTVFLVKSANTVGAASTLQLTTPTFYAASSTVFTITTTTSVRILATSSPVYRAAATIQPVNCTVGGQLYMQLNRDVVAVARTGLAAFASTTMELKAFPGVPIVQGSVQAITDVGTCTVLVTEWRFVQ